MQQQPNPVCYETVTVDPQTGTVLTTVPGVVDETMVRPDLVQGSGAPQRQEVVEHAMTEVPVVMEAAQGTVPVVLVHRDPETRREKREEDYDSDGGMTYRERVKRVREMLLGTEEVTQEEKVNAVLSMDEPRSSGKIRLPHSVGFLQFFKEFEDETAGIGEGSDKKRRTELAMGSFPKDLKAKMKSYQMQDCPWEKNPRADTGLGGSVVHPDKETPRVVLKMNEVEKAEQNQRNMLSITSYVDTFLWATKEKVKETMKKLDSTRYQEEPSMNFEQIQDLYEELEMCLEFMQSTARGVQDIVKSAVNGIGFFTLARRDAYIWGMSKILGKDTKIKMRQGGINDSMLFGEEKLKEARKKVVEDKRDLMQDKFLGTATSKEGNSYGSGNNNYSSRGNNFRGNRGRGRGYGRGENLWNKTEGEAKRVFRGGNYRPRRGRN